MVRKAVMRGAHCIAFITSLQISDPLYHGRQTKRQDQERTNSSTRREIRKKQSLVAWRGTYAAMFCLHSVVVGHRYDMAKGQMGSLRGTRAAASFGHNCPLPFRLREPRLGSVMENQVECSSRAAAIDSELLAGNEKSKDAETRDTHLDPQLRTVRLNKAKASPV
jgi:hypothetical protein